MAKAPDNFELVSLYQVKGRWRVSTPQIGGRRITRRLGTNAAHARRYAAQVSDWMQQLKGRLITEAKVLQLLGESLRVPGLIEQYRAELVGKGRNRQYVADTVARLKLLFDRAGVLQAKQITVAAVTRGLNDLRERGGVDAGELSDQTLRHYQTAARQFGKWLARKGHVERDPLEHVEALSVDEVKHRRRAPTRLEAKLLIDHLWDLPRGRFRTAGRDRAMLYLLAMSTGLRVNELRQVRRDWIDRETGILAVPGSVTKNDDEALQPLPRWLLDAIDDWHRGDPLLVPLVPSQPAVTLRADQVAARAAWLAAADDAAERERRATSATLVYRTPAGVFDFHALRHFYVTTIQASGATVRDTQTLARHSTPMLTLGTYSHSEAEKLRGVIETAFADPRPTKGEHGEAQAQSAAQSG